MSCFFFQHSSNRLRKNLELLIIPEVYAMSHIPKVTAILTLLTYACESLGEGSSDSHIVYEHQHPFLRIPHTLSLKTKYNKNMIF
jgi:hypothetical protein